MLTTGTAPVAAATSNRLPPVGSGWAPPPPVVSQRSAQGCSLNAKALIIVFLNAVLVVLCCCRRRRHHRRRCGPRWILTWMTTLSKSKRTSRSRSLRVAMRTTTTALITAAVPLDSPRQARRLSRASVLSAASIDVVISCLPSFICVRKLW